MTTLTGILLLLTLIVLTGLAAWDVWLRTAPQDEEWFTEDDERRQPSWRRI